MSTFKEKWRARVEQIETPNEAAALHNQLMEYRHDSFGKAICQALRITYRNDITFQELKKILEENGITGVPDLSIKYTPDNVYVNENKDVYIIDYKVSANQNYYEVTLQKYINGFRLLQANIKHPINIVILALNPYDYTIYCNNPDFLQMLFGMNQPNFMEELGWIDDLLQEILNHFGANEDFLNLKNYDSFDYTTPWVEDDCKDELDSDPNYVEFVGSLSEKERTTFLEFLEFDLENSTQKDLDDLYYKALNEYAGEVKEEKEQIIKKIRDQNNLTTKTPNIQVINEAWTKLEGTVREKKQLMDSIDDASPTLHILWGRDIPLLKEMTVGDNFERMCSIAAIFKRIHIENPDLDNIGSFLKRIGFMQDLALHKEAYIAAVNVQKSHPPNKKRKPIPVSNAFVYHDQQFYLPNTPERKKLYQQAHIGTDKKFKMRANDDPIIEKPQMLNPFNTALTQECIEKINSTKQVLGQIGPQIYQKNIILEYMQKIKESMSEQSYAKLETLLRTDYYKYLVDSSQLMKGALAMSEVTYPDTYRLIFSASKTSGLILLPSSNIESARATICYITYVIHTEPLAYTGCEHETYTVTKGLYVTVSKVIRLDKERCKKIVESPNLFIILASTLIHNNPDEELNNILNYSFYMALNITKSVMSLTEPGRYLVMGASSLACNVGDYISDKLDPITKTVFSIYLFDKLRVATTLAYTGLRELLAGEILLEAESIVKKGPKKEPTIKSVWFEARVNLESYITEIFLPFYINQKGLHYYHHNIISLTRVPLEIEKENRSRKKSNPQYWREKSDTKQHVDVPVLMSYLAKYHLKHKNKFNQFRSNLENKANFKKPIYLKRTLTSSKSCIKVGNFSKIKGRQSEKKPLTKPREVANTYVAKHKSNMHLVSSNLLDTNGYTKVVIMNTMGYILDTNIRHQLETHGLVPLVKEYKISETYTMDYNGTQLLFIAVDDNLPGLP